MSWGIVISMSDLPAGTFTSRVMEVMAFFVSVRMLTWTLASTATAFGFSAWIANSGFPEKIQSWTIGTENVRSFNVEGSGSSEFAGCLQPDMTAVTKRTAAKKSDTFLNIVMRFYSSLA